MIYDVRRVDTTMPNNILRYNLLVPKTLNEWSIWRNNINGVKKILLLNLFNAYVFIYT